MVISPFGFTRLSFATLPCRTQNLLWHDESVIANSLMSIPFGLMPLLVSCTFVACRSLCIIVHAPPSSADTAVRSDFPLRFSRHTAIAVPLSFAYGLPPCLQPLFHCLAPSFSELSYLKATYFYHAKVAWCCEGLPPSCVAAIAVTNKIVRNLPFSSSLSFIANKKTSIANDFHGASHMVPHPCFWMHVKIKFHF